MSRSEFRWNKKRKHYAYLFKDKGEYRLNLLISSKPVMIRKKSRKKKYFANILLFHHPNPFKEGLFYIVPIIYVDNINSFDSKIYISWSFDKNDKRKIKRLKKQKKSATKPVRANH